MSHLYTNGHTHTRKVASRAVFYLSRICNKNIILLARLETGWFDITSAAAHPLTYDMSPKCAHVTEKRSARKKRCTPATLRTNCRRVLRRNCLKNVVQQRADWKKAQNAESDSVGQFLDECIRGSSHFSPIDSIWRGIKTVLYKNSCTTLSDAYHDSKWFDMRSSACHVLFHIHSARVILVAVSPTWHTQHLPSHIKT